MVLRFLKLTQSYCINKFPFFLCYSQISFKFASNSFQVCFKFVSNSLQIRSRIRSLSEFFKNSLQFVLENCLQFVSSVLDVQPFIFIKENWIYTMTRHYANNILLARNLHFDIRQWSHPSMIPLHCLWTKSNNRTSGQVEYIVTLFFCLFLFNFVHLHARCDCCSVVCLRFQIIQIYIIIITLIHFMNLVF